MGILTWRQVWCSLSQFNKQPAAELSRAAPHRLEGAGIGAALVRSNGTRDAAIGEPVSCAAAGSSPEREEAAAVTFHAFEEQESACPVASSFLQQGLPASCTRHGKCMTAQA